MKNQNFGIEIEMTGITRSTAAKVIAGYFHTEATHVGGCYDAYSVRDNDGRMWKIMRVFGVCLDASIWQCKPQLELTLAPAPRSFLTNS